MDSVGADDQGAGNRKSQRQLRPDLHGASVAEVHRCVNADNWKKSSKSAKVRTVNHIRRAVDEIGPCSNGGMHLSRIAAFCLSGAACVSSSIVLSGCSARANAAQSDRDLRPASAEGVVRIAEASRQFIVVEPAWGDARTASLRAPARVEFRDGALSRLAAPLNGRVIGVHVRTGDRVKAGDALVDLDCPDAAAARSSIATVTANLSEARVALERERRMLEQGVGIEREKLAAETRRAELESELAPAQA